MQPEEGALAALLHDLRMQQMRAKEQGPSSWHRKLQKAKESQTHTVCPHTVCPYSDLKTARFKAKTITWKQEGAIYETLQESFANYANWCVLTENSLDFELQEDYFLYCVTVAAYFEYWDRLINLMLRSSTERHDPDEPKFYSLNDEGFVTKDDIIDDWISQQSNEEVIKYINLLETIEKMQNTIDKIDALYKNHLYCKQQTEQLYQFDKTTLAKEKEEDQRVQLECYEELSGPIWSELQTRLGKQIEQLHLENDVKGAMQMHANALNELFSSYIKELNIHAEGYTVLWETRTKALDVLRECQTQLKQQVEHFACSVQSNEGFGVSKGYFMFLKDWYSKFERYVKAAAFNRPDESDTLSGYHLLFNINPVLKFTYNTHLSACEDPNLVEILGKNLDAYEKVQENTSKRKPAAVKDRLDQQAQKQEADLALELFDLKLEEKGADEFVQVCDMSSKDNQTHIRQTIAYEDFQSRNERNGPVYKMSKMSAMFFSLFKRMYTTSEAVKAMMPKTLNDNKAYSSQVQDSLGAAAEGTTEWGAAAEGTTEWSLHQKCEEMLKLFLPYAEFFYRNILYFSRALTANIPVYRFLMIKLQKAEEKLSTEDKEARVMNILKQMLHSRQVMSTTTDRYMWSTMLGNLVNHVQDEERHRSYYVQVFFQIPTGCNVFPMFRTSAKNTADGMSGEESELIITSNVRFFNFQPKPVDDHNDAFYRKFIEPFISRKFIRKERNELYGLNYRNYECTVEVLPE